MIRLTLLVIGAAVAGLIASPCSAADIGVAPMPDTMLAVAFDKGGGPDVLAIHHLPVPKLNAGEVLIAVHATGVNVWEAAYRQHAGSEAHFPVVPGSDGSGTVAAIGSGVRGFKVGDEVYATSGAFYAEYATARAENVAHLPKGISLTQAGILAISGLSALQGIDDVLRLQTGETLIIHGAAGAVGTLAVQFAKLRGAKVLATATDDAGLALVSRLGADAVVNGRTEDIAAAAKRFAPRGVDAVLGFAGGDALEHCIDALRQDDRGRVAYLYGVEPAPKPRFGMQMTLYSYVSGSSEFERLNKAVEAAHLQVPIAAEYPLTAAADAHRRLEAGHLLGKIVLRIH
jgi:NADPH:quinone reductase-like Zn-dependent oxidoreductase